MIRIAFGCCVLCVLVTVGCARSPLPISTEFRVRGPIVDAPYFDSLPVVFAEDARANKAKIGEGGRLALIPLWPCSLREDPAEYAAAAFGQPYSLSIDLAETVAKDINAAGIARKAYATGQGVSKHPSTHVLTLRLNKATFRRHCTFYGLSIIGVIPLALGAPTAFGGRVDLEFEATLYGPGATVVASSRFESTEGVTEFLYSAHTAGGIGLLRNYDRLSPDLRAFMASAGKKRMEAVVPEK